MLIQSSFRHAAQWVPNPEAQLLAANSQPSAVSLYSANAVIYAQGEPTGYLYLVEFGTVRICRLTADGRRQISAFHFAGEVFGFEFGDERHFYAESVDGVGVRVLRPKRGDQLAQSMLPVALKSLTRAQEHLLVLGRQNGVEKIAAFLLDIAERQASDRFIDLSMQRCDIADYLGLSFETVSRVLTKMKVAGTIRIPHVKQIELLDIDQLQQLRG